MLKFNVSSIITFDYNQALQFTGRTGPYLQYSYARALGILKKNNISDNIKISEVQNISQTEENLITLEQWDKVVEKSK